VDEVKISGPIHPELTHYEWKLSEDEMGRLREILSDFDSYCVKDFISHFEYLCQGVLIRSESDGFYKRPSKENRKKNILDAIRDLEKARIVAENILKVRISTFIPYGLADPQEYNWGAELLKSHSLAIGIEKDIGKLIDILKGSPDLSSKTGSPGTIAKEFAIELSGAYMEHIGRPTTTYSGNPHKGQFYEIVEFAFEIVGLPNNDVSKLVISACQKRGRKPIKKV
jgi:hypothetical protein